MGLIYKLTSPSGKSYIGQTSVNFSVRFSQHKRAARDGSTCPIHNALRKYGAENFFIEILEEDIPENLLNEREQYYIQKYDTYNNGYNATIGGEGNKKIPDQIILELWDQGLCCSDIATILEVQNHTISDRMRQLRPQDERERRRYSIIGKKEGFSDEEKEKILSLWKKGYNCTAIGKELNHERHSIARTLYTFGITAEEIQERMRQTANTNKCISIYQYDKEGNFIQRWESMSAAGRALGIGIGEISSVCSGKKRSAGGFIWRKENIESGQEN